MTKPVKKRFDLTITEEEGIVTKTFELDKTIKTVKGLLVASDKDDVLYYRGSQKIEINNEEIFPDGYESKLLMSGINVSPKQRYYDIGSFSPGNGIIKVTFVDQADNRADFENYRVSLYLDCEMEDAA